MNILQEVKSLAQSFLQGLSINAGKFGEIVGVTFSENYDVVASDRILRKWQSGDFSDLPTVNVLPAADLFGAVGAYSSELNQVYLSDSFVGTGNVDLINSVLLEEYGHYLDAKINTFDTAGDEGAVFSLLARGEEVSPDLLASLQAENDSSFAIIDGELVAVENANITLTVNTTFDQNDGGTANSLSLRDAILIANADLANTYTILLQSATSYLLTQEGVNDDESLTGDLDILGKVTIKTLSGGPATITAGSLANRERVFSVLGSTARLNLENVTIVGGSNSSRVSQPFGGGISVRSGELNIFGSTIRDNSAEYGGGIYVVNGTLNVSKSTISNNTAIGSIIADGGGIHIEGNAIVTISNSTISGNSAMTSGGGIASGGAELSIANTTISNNIAGEGDGGGISLYVGRSAALRNTIVAGNFDNSPTGGAQPDISGNISGNNFNLIGNLSGASGTIGTGTDIVNAKSGLAPLGNYGGTTQTQALFSSSPALNAGNNNLIPGDVLDPNSGTAGFIPTDQRGNGFPRIVGVNVDIGAFEGVLPPPVINTSIYRFQNSNVPGTYLFVGESERQSILRNFTNFKEEGVAFKVATSTGENLIPLNRFQNSAVPGTYLYAGESESANIRRNFTNFREEGVAFYVYSPGSGGSSFNRFQNRNLPGTYLFAGPSETASILRSFANFVNEGVAFGAAG